MKKWVALLAFIAVCAAAFFFFRPAGSPPVPVVREEAIKKEPLAPPVSANSVAPVSPPASSGIPSSPGAGSSSPSVARNAPAEPVLPGVPHPLEFSNLPPTIVLDALRRTFHTYASMFHGNPVGTNPEITSALSGNNPGQANFIKAEAGMRINDRGELVDSWGTPYFFHQLSGTEMEIHSAGPDKVMWTGDDLVTK